MANISDTVKAALATLNGVKLMTSNGLYVGPLLGDLLTMAIQSDPLEVWTGTADPSIAPGVPGSKAGDLYLRDAPGAGGGQLWINVGDTATSWTLVNTVAGTNLNDGHIFVGNAGNIATDVAMSSEASIVASGAVTLANSAVIGKALTGFVSGAGAVTAGDSILAAIQHLDGNVAATVIVANAALPSASFTDAAVTAKVLGAGYLAAPGTVTIGDTLEVALEKLDGNIGAISLSTQPAAPSGNISCGNFQLVDSTKLCLDNPAGTDGGEIDFNAQDAFVLANALKITINSHAADGTLPGGEHQHGGGNTPDIVNFPVTAADAIDNATLLALTGAMVLAYRAHNADAILAGGGTYHNAPATTHPVMNTGGGLLPYVPVTLAQAVTRLNDLKSKYNLHDLDAVAHTIGGTHQEATPDTFLSFIQSSFDGTELYFKGFTSVQVDNDFQVNAGDILVSTGGIHVTSGDIVAEIGNVIGHVTIVPDAAADHPLALTDDGTFIDMSNAGPCTVTIPLNATVPFPVGTTISIRQLGAGQVTITPVGGGVTLQSVGGLLSTSAQFAVVSILQVSTDVWAVFGSLA